MSKYPNKDYTFFGNMFEHLTSNNYRLSLVCEEISNADNLNLKLQTIYQAIKARINVLDPLIDIYDYMDEFLGVIAYSPLFALMAIEAIFKTLFNILAVISAFSVSNDSVYAQSLEDTQNCFAAASLLFLLATGTLVKSLINIISRPLATLANQEFEESPVERFEDDRTNSIFDYMNSLLCN